MVPAKMDMSYYKKNLSEKIITKPLIVSTFVVFYREKCEAWVFVFASMWRNEEMLRQICKRGGFPHIGIVRKKPIKFNVLCFYPYFYFSTNVHDKMLPYITIDYLCYAV